MKAKKSLGQHFLRSEKALRAIVQAGDINQGDTVVEIGPGTGALTARILGTDAKVIAIEKDDSLYELLKEKFSQEIKKGRLNLIRQDILDFDPSVLKFYQDFSYKIIANIPYNITGAILKKFLGADCQPKMMVLLVQKEVAKRIIAKNKKESILSVSIKAYGAPKFIETVKAGSFAPRPKVDSAIIVIENISKKKFRGVSEKNFFEVVRAGFKSKRKKLSSNLSVKCAKDKIQKIFQKLDLNDNLRAEDINIETWRELIRSLNRHL